MPLLGSNRFECQSLPDDLKLEDEVYVCKATGELFTDYEKFFDRTILCNSLIWTCEVTGHTGMTFAEALESEKNSRRQLEMFPSALQVPILHLVSLTKRTIFKDLLDDVFSFVKDRYFVGEKISISTGTEKKPAIIIKVFPMANSFNQPLGEIFTDIDRENGDSRKSSKRGCLSDSASFQYLSQDQSTGIAVMSISKNMSRDKNSFNRDSCKLFLKEHCEHKGKGMWRLKGWVTKRYNLYNVKFTDYFAGPIPIFSGVCEVEKRNYIHQGSDLQESNSKKKVGESTKDLSKPRDDLLCDDLKDLPKASSLMLFEKDFGSAIIVMEFLSCFSSFCGIELPENFSISGLDECLDKQECDSFFIDLIQGFLTAIFKVQLGGSEIQQVWKVTSKGQSDSDLQFGLTLVQFFSSVGRKSKSHKFTSLETPLKRLPLNGSSLTEVLRLHLLIGGSESSTQMDSVFEMSLGHMAAEFNTSNPDIMKKLHVGNILDLKPGEKLKILSTLIDQVLSLPSCRDYIEEKYQKLKNFQKDLRNHVWAIQRRERDLFNYNIKKGEEEKVSIEEKHKCSLQLMKKKSILHLKDKDFKDMPMEGIDWDQLTQEEKDHIKNWSERHMLELQNLVDSAQDDYCVTPIGMDRTFRRYWIFKSVPGLFVENSKEQDVFISLECLSHTALNMTKVKNKEIFKKSLNSMDSSQGNVEWSFYSAPEDLEILIESLNDQGHRESNLKSCLIKSKQKILKSMVSCDVESLRNKNKKSNEEEYSNQDKFTCLCAKKYKGELELLKIVANMVLDLEERIFSGGLGQLKFRILNREEWRKGVEVINDVHNCHMLGITDCKILELYTHDKMVLSLKQWLKDMVEMVDPKYIGPPIASSSQESFQGNTDVLYNNQIFGADSIKFMELLFKCSNFSQIYLCLVLLDSSIIWAKAPHNISCKVCRKKKDGESMLLCDRCDQGHHIYCLSPPLKKIPEGDWFCPSCQPNSLVMNDSIKASKSNRYKDCDSDLSVDDESLCSYELGSSFTEMPVVGWKDELTVRRNHKRKKHLNSTKEDMDKLYLSKVTNSPASECQDLLSPVVEFKEDILTPHNFKPVKSRSGREIVRPRCDVEQFVSQKLSASSLEKKDIFGFNTGICSSSFRKRRNIRDVKYNYEFDYNNCEDYEGFESCINGETILKKRHCANKIKDQTHPVRSRRISTLSIKHSQRKINASMKAIEDLVNDLTKNDNAWPFLKPVTIKQAPDYFDIVKNPIDLSTIKYKIYRFEYEDQNEIVKDLRLMLYNCNLYNCPNTPVHDAGIALESYLNKKLESIYNNSLGVSSDSHLTSI